MQENIIITQADIADIERLHEIEQQCFPPEKAAGRDAFEYRLKNFPQWFLKAEVGGVIAGLIDGSRSDRLYITDDLYDEGSAFSDKGDNLLIYGLAVAPEYRHRKIAHRLMAAILDKARGENLRHISLTCKGSLIPFYESFGYTNHGLSESVKGDVVSYDMEINFS